MFARLTALVGSGGGLPFDVFDPYPSAWGQWTHFKGSLKADGSPVSVFRVSASSKNDQKLQAARNGVKRLRTLRHPNILSFKDTVEVEERGETALYLVTEAVAPLSSTLRTLGIEGSQREQYLSMGLHQVVAAVSFLNNDCKLIHGGLCSAAVVVTESLDWKLHGFDLTTEYEWAEAMTSEIPLAASAWMLGPQYKAGEVANREWQAVRDGPAWGVDAWGLGGLMQELFSGAPLARTEDLRNTGAIPQPLLQYYQRLLSTQPARRLNPAKLAESGVLKTKLVELMAFLENLSLKDAAEKDAFFKRLPALLPNIPQPVAQRKLLPLLASALEFGGAPPVALTSLLKIGEGLSEEERGRQVVPILTKLFASNDRAIRRGLLENIASFGPGMPAAVVEEQIYPNVQSGFIDSNPYLRELTLKSMVVLGPKLGQKTLNQSLLKHLAKLQVDEEPAIRANTTVLLGNLAPQLSEATCKKVLLNAFARALRDPFPPARIAGLKAILATAKFHGPEDAAGRVLPMAAPLAIDGVGEVRGCALQCLDHFTRALRENHEATQARAAAAGGEAGGDAAAAGGAGGSLLTSFGWAVSSLVARGGTGDGPPGSGPVGFGSSSTGGTATSAAVPSSAAPPGGGSGVHSTAQHSTARPAAPVAPGGGARKASSAPWEEPPAAASEGWDDAEFDPVEGPMADSVAAEREARQKLAKASVSRPSAAGSRAPAAGKPSSGTSEGWDDDGWEAQGAAAPPPAKALRPVAAARRPAAAAGVRRPGGGGMKLAGKKLAKDDDFSEW